MNIPELDVDDYKLIVRELEHDITALVSMLLWHHIDDCFSLQVFKVRIEQNQEISPVTKNIILIIINNLMKEYENK
jgi:hypothetical protein